MDAAHVIQITRHYGQRVSYRMRRGVQHRRRCHVRIEVPVLQVYLLDICLGQRQSRRSRWLACMQLRIAREVSIRVERG
jgi:hypothetical protein